MASAQKTFAKLFNEMAHTSFDTGSQFYAKPTYIVAPNDFYIIPFPYIYHLAAISEPENPVQIKDLKQNMVVIFTSKRPDVNHYFKIELDDNIRGIIMSIDDEKNCKIKAIDRGFVENNVSADHIFHPAHPEAIETPPLVQHCELDMCASIGPSFSEDAIDAFKFYIGNEKLSIVTRGRSMDKLKVVVYNSNPDDIATLLALTGYTTLFGSIRNHCSNLTSACSGRPKITYRHMQPKIGETLQVRVQSGDSLSSFYVSQMSSYKKYLENRANFTNYCKAQAEIKPEDFVPGTLVGVKDNDIFYERAVILEILVSDSKAKVKLVDWGSELNVSKNMIKAIKTELFTTLPVHALYCSAAKGFVPWDNGLPKFLYKGYTFSITVKRVGKGFETPHIVFLTQT